MVGDAVRFLGRDGEILFLGAAKARVSVERRTIVVFIVIVGRVRSEPGIEKTRI